METLEQRIDGSYHFDPCFRDDLEIYDQFIYDYDYDYDYNFEHFEDRDEYESLNNEVELRRQTQGRNILNNLNNIDFSSLQYLISLNQTNVLSNDISEEYKNKLSLYDFKKNNLNKLKEDLLYYFSSPETIVNFQNNSEEELYDFYKNLDCENFISSQNERIKIILSKSYFDSQMKNRKLSNFNNSFCVKASLITNREKYKNAIISTNLIELKYDELSFSINKEKIDENKIISLLYELKGIFNTHKIEMESLGFTFFKSVEKNLIFILNTIEDKLSKLNNIKNLSTFILICVDILKSFNSTKLYFFIIKFLKQRNNILNSIVLESNEEKIQFIPNNCFNFEKMSKYVNKILINDLIQPLNEQGLNKNKFNFNSYDYKTLNYEDFLLIFILPSNNNENKETYYFKFNLIETKLIDIGKISLLSAINFSAFCSK